MVFLNALVLEFPKSDDPLQSYVQNSDNFGHVLCRAGLEALWAAACFHELCRARSGLLPAAVDWVSSAGVAVRVSGGSSVVSGRN